MHRAEPDKTFQGKFRPMLYEERTDDVEERGDLSSCFDLFELSGCAFLNYAVHSKTIAAWFRARNWIK